MLNIVVDENMPDVERYFSSLGNITKVHGRSLTQTQLKQTDILLVRSITKVDESLLEGTPVKFVGTATIGTDHLDTKYLETNHIAYASAPGCNAQSVAEFVVAAVLELHDRNKLDLNTARVAIIGAGNTGSALSDVLRVLGIEYVLYDPPLVRVSDTRELVSWQEVLQCNVISLHVPLIMDGEDATIHLINKANLDKFAGKTVINACRGAVVSKDCISYGQKELGISFVLDVWDEEPVIDNVNIDSTVLATPHIAGYSKQGKTRGTYLLYKALCEYLDSSVDTEYLNEAPSITMPSAYANPWQYWLQIWRQSYDIRHDDLRFRQLAKELPTSFDRQRKDYPKRLEIGFKQIKELAKAL